MAQKMKNFNGADSEIHAPVVSHPGARRVLLLFGSDLRDGGITKKVCAMQWLADYQSATEEKQICY